MGKPLTGPRHVWTFRILHGSSSQAGAWIEAKETAALVGHWKKPATLLAVDVTVP